VVVSGGREKLKRVCKFQKGSENSGLRRPGTFSEFMRKNQGREKETVRSIGLRRGDQKREGNEKIDRWLDWAYHSKTTQTAATVVGSTQW